MGPGFGTWFWDLDLGLGFGTWIWDLDLGLDLGLTISHELMSGPLQSNQAQINSPSNPRLDPIDSKSSCYINIPSGAASPDLLRHVAARVGAESSGKREAKFSSLTIYCYSGDRDDHPDHGEGPDQVRPVLARTGG